MNAGKLLIVDDEAAHSRALCEALRAAGHIVHAVGAPSQALEALRSEPFDVLITDLALPGADGIAFLNDAQQIDADIAGVVMTRQEAIDAAVEAMRAGAYDYLVKPFRLTHLLPVIGRALEARRLRRYARELEARVRKGSEELEITTRDFEAFSHAVSHDLRAPLRQIQGFCELFLERHSNSLSADGNALLQHVWGGAARVGQMIEGLLELDRCGRDPLIAQSIAMKPLVEEVIAELAAPGPTSRVQIAVSELPDCRADPRLVRQVLCSLLSNALKFTARSERPRIEVGSLDREGRRSYFVKDNGAGFDPKYVHRLFTVFQRLHSQEEFAGTGVGLCIVRRIVERHGGAAWAEGRPGEGATFYFSLPASAQEGLSVGPGP